MPKPVELARLRHGFLSSPEEIMDAINSSLALSTSPGKSPTLL